MNRDQKVWNCLLLSLGKEWGNKKVHRTMGVEQKVGQELRLCRKIRRLLSAIQS